MSLLNGLLKHPDFYHVDSWADISLSDEANTLTQRSRLTEIEQERRNLLLLAAAFPSAIDIVDSTAISLTYGTAVVQGPIPLTPDQFEMLFEQILIAVVGVFLGFFGVFGCLLVTAGLIPRTFEPGEIALLLSKPVSRSLLFVVKFFGGCVFTLLYSAVLVVGIWVLLGLRMDFWRHELLWCIPVYVFLFMIYYAVSAVAGAIWRNSIVALSLVVVFWLLLTVVGITREALKENLIDQRGIKDIVHAGADVITIDGEQNTWVWNKETETWTEVFKELPGGIGALARMFLSSGARFVPVFDSANDRILALQQTASRFGGPGASKLVTGSAAEGWDRHELAQVPDFVPAVLVTSEGRIILPAQKAIYEYVGQIDEARARSDFLSSISGGLLGRTTNGFTELQPDDLPDLGEKFAVALDPLSDELFLYGKGHLHRLSAAEDGRYSVARSRDFETESNGLIAASGDFVVLALRSGSIQILERESLETVHQMQLEQGIKLRRCAASGDGSGLAILTSDDTLLLFDSESRKLQPWLHPNSQVCSAVAWSPDHNLIVADGRLTVQEYPIGNAEGDPVDEWSEPTTWVYQFYDYVIVPAWTMLPKPSQLDEFVAYVMTRRNDDASAEFRGFGNRNNQVDQDASFEPVPVIRDNAIFVVLLLAFGCVYISRRDF